MLSAIRFVRLCLYNNIKSIYTQTGSIDKFFQYWKYKNVNSFAKVIRQFYLSPQYALFAFKQLTLIK